MISNPNILILPSGDVVPTNTPRILDFLKGVNLDNITEISTYGTLKDPSIMSKFIHPDNYGIQRDGYSPLLGVVDGLWARALDHGSVDEARRHVSELPKKPELYTVTWRISDNEIERVLDDFDDYERVAEGMYSRELMMNVDGSFSWVYIANPEEPGVVAAMERGSFTNNYPVSKLMPFIEADHAIKELAKQDPTLTKVYNEIVLSRAYQEFDAGNVDHEDTERLQQENVLLMLQTVSLQEDQRGTYKLLDQLTNVDHAGVRFAVAKVQQAYLQELAK